LLILEEKYIKKIMDSNSFLIISNQRNGASATHKKSMARAIFLLVLCPMKHLKGGLLIKIKMIPFMRFKKRKIAVKLQRQYEIARWFGFYTDGIKRLYPKQIRLKAILMFVKLKVNK